MTILNNSEIKLIALALTVRSQRWTKPVEAPQRSIVALQTRFYSILRQKGIQDREVRLRLASDLVGRTVDSFSDLFGGEIQALLEESDLKEILNYMIDSENKNV